MTAPKRSMLRGSPSTRASYTCVRWLRGWRADSDWTVSSAGRFARGGTRRVSTLRSQHTEPSHSRACRHENPTMFGKVRLPGRSGAAVSVHRDPRLPDAIARCIGGYRDSPSTPALPARPILFQRIRHIAIPFRGCRNSPLQYILLREHSQVYATNNRHSLPGGTVRQPTQTSSAFASIRPPTTYEEVMRDDQTRHAFCNTTQGVLYGDPKQDEVTRILAILDNSPVAYLFATDLDLPRPMFRTKKLICVGEDEIIDAIDHLSTGHR